MELNIAASTGAPELPPLDKATGIAWKWILEKLVDLPAARAPLLQGVISHVPDIEEPQCQQLLEKVAVRYLEEMVVSNQLDTAAIPLIQTLTKQKVAQEIFTSEQRSQNDLVLQVQTGAVLSFIRKASEDGNRDWAGFASALDHVFPEEEGDPQDAHRRKELVAYLFPKNHKEESALKLLAKYPREKLNQDLLSFLDQKKASFQSSFLDKLSQEVLKGRLPLNSFQDELPTDQHSPVSQNCLVSPNFEHMENRSNSSPTVMDEEEVQEVPADLQVKNCRQKITEKGPEVERLDNQCLNVDMNKLVDVGEEYEPSNRAEENKAEWGPSGLNERKEDGQRQKIAENNIKADSQDGNIMNVPKRMKRAMEAEKVHRQEDALQDEKKMNGTAVKWRRLVLSGNITNDQKEEARNRHKGAGTEEQKQREVNANGLPQKSSGKRHEAEEIFCRQISEDTMKKKRRNVRYMDFTSEEEEGKVQHGTTRKQNRTTKIDTMAAEKLDASPAKSLKKRDGSRRGVTAINRLQNENSYGEASTVTKRTQSEHDTQRLFRENSLRKQFSSRAPDMTMPLRQTKKVPNQAAEAPKLTEITSSEAETVRHCRGFLAEQVAWQETSERSVGEWQLRKQALRHAAMERCIGVLKLPKQSQTPSQGEIVKFFDKLRPSAERDKKGIGVTTEKRSENGELIRFAKSMLGSPVTQVLCSSCSKFYRPDNTNNSDVNFGTDDTTPITKENPSDWLQQKEKEEFELNHGNSFLPKELEDRILNPKAKSLGGRGNIALEFLEIGSDGHEERCHKCQKFGELLCCDGCPIAMHRSCLEPLIMKVPEAAQEWFCPVCYEKKAKKRAAQAEQTATEARAKLDAFIQESSKTRRQSEGGTLQRNKTKKSHKFIMHGSAPVKKTSKRDISPFDIREQTKELLERSALRSEMAAAQMAMLVHEASRPERWKAIFHESVSSDEDQNNDDGHEQNNDVRRTEVNASDIREKLRVGKKGCEPASCLVGNDVHLDDEGASPTGSRVKRQESSSQHARARHILEKEARTEKDLRRMSARDLKEGEWERIGISQAATERQQGSDTEHSPLPPDHPAENIEVETEDRGIRSANGEVEGDKHDVDLEALGDKMKERFSKLVYGGRRRIPGLRRKVLPWTRDEEDALKEGVQKYSPDCSWGFQWTRILEYGMGRFDPSRTAVDLKDKWRNFQRGLAYSPPPSTCNL